MSETFLVQTEIFQGPLDLLLTLIEKRKLLINEISLAKITDDYLSYVENAENLSLKNNAHFILVAATLVLIKSKSLLPTLELDDEEQQSIEELEARLKIYKRFKETEPWILESYGKKRCYYALPRKNLEIEFAPAKNVSLESIHQSIKNIIASFPKQEKIPHKTVKKIISLEESISKLSNQIRQNLSLSFKQFAGVKKEDRINIVVSFLAMLELVKQGVIQVSQSGEYQDIEMQTQEFETPNYS